MATPYTFVVNKGYNNEREVVADTFVTQDDLVDFVDDDGIVLRLSKGNVYSVERKPS